MKFLWFLATSDSKVLQQVEDKTERIWHSIIGTFVLITGIFAFITGSFTANLIMNGPEAGENSWMLPVGAGIVWAFLIITIDRLLIASIASERKNRIKAKQQGGSEEASKTGFLSRKMKSSLCFKSSLCGQESRPTSRISRASFNSSLLT